MGDVGREGAGQTSFEIAFGAVVEHRLGGRDLSGDVGNVVGQDLMLVRSTTGRELTDCAPDHVAAELDDVGGAGEVGSRQLESLVHRSEATDGR